MLFYFDTREAINDLVAGGVPEPQAIAISAVWLRILQQFQVFLHPEHAALRQEQSMHKFEQHMRRVQRLLEKLSPRPETPES